MKTLQPSQSEYDPIGKWLFIGDSYCTHGGEPDLPSLIAKEIGIKEYRVSSNGVRIYDEIKPLELLTKLDKKGIEVNDIRTSEMSVEEYYLNMIGGSENA